MYRRLALWLRVSPQPDLQNQAEEAQNLYRLKSTTVNLESSQRMLWWSL
jgi:hypothetical protein